MSSEYARPSIDPANYDSLTGAFREIFKKLMQSIDGVLPARIINYDRNKRRAQVQISISMINTNGQIIPRAQIDNVRVVHWGGGNWVVDFPIARGSVGWLIACDRDISIFSQNGQDAKPNTLRMKNFSDSFFIPDVFSNYTPAINDAEKDMVIQSLDGLVKILLGENTIRIQAPNVIIDSASINLESTANINITAPSGVSVTTPVLAVDGNITATGSITPGV